MCVIITSESENRRPSLAVLRACAEQNPHGSGVAWLSRRSVEYVKDFDADEVDRLLRGIGGPVIIHFRIASVGAVTPRLCHPFPVTHRAELRGHSRARSVLFHNGTWTEWRSYAEHFGIQFPKREPVSDTRVAATLVARFGFSWLERFDYCRWATLGRAGIRRIGNWTSFEGCHFSNMYWRRTRRDPADWWKQK